MRLTLLAALIFIILLPLASADLVINIVSYNPDTQKARILVANTGNTDYTDISFALDDMTPMEFKGSTIKAGTAITIPKLVPQGMHTITITTSEGVVFSQELLFAPSGKQVNLRIKGQGAEAATAPRQTTPSKGKSHAFLYIVLIALAGLAVGAYIYARRNPQILYRVKGFFYGIKGFVMRLFGKQPTKPVLASPMQRQYQRPIYQQRYARQYRMPPRTPPRQFLRRGR
jgi:hypothetical protein